MKKLHAIILIIAVLLLLFAFFRIASNLGAVPVNGCFGAETKVYRNISYGMNKNQKFDLHTPANPDEKLPLIIFVHGGAWIMGDKRQFDCDSAFLAKNGYIVININYRLLPNFSYPAPLEDMQGVLLWAKENSSKYNIDTSHIGMTGHSAGAHLIALYALTQDKPYLSTTKNIPNVYAIAPIAGGYDLERVEDTWWRKYTILKWLETADPPSLGDPISQIDAADNVTFLLLHGTQDNLAPSEQSQFFYDALVAAGIPVKLKIYLHHTHTTIVAGIHEGDTVAQEMLVFFNGNLK